jgi:hypothetical protein
MRQQRAKVVAAFARVAATYAKRLQGDFDLHGNHRIALAAH